MRRPLRLRPLALAVALALTALVTACATPEAPAPAAPVAPAEPAPPAEPEEPVAEEPAPTLAVHFVRSGPVSFFVEPVEVDASGVLEGMDLAAMNAEERALAAARLLFSATPTDPDLTTSVPTDVTVTGVTVVDGVATVDVDEAMRATGGSSSQEVTFAQQLAHTIVDIAGVDAVLLTIGGEGITELWGHLDWSRPLEPDPFALSPITIVTPSHGASTPAGDVEVTGLATVFEATLLVRVYNAAGTVVLDTFTTASEGGPGRGTWSIMVTLTPGTWTIEAEAPDMSDGEGPPPFVTRRTVDVS